MRRRIIDLCLLAYPRLREGRDRDYLRDLALELSECYGLGRQALSLLGGGMSERSQRMKQALRARARSRRLATACALAATAVTAIGLGGVAANAERRAEVERFRCLPAVPASAQRGDRAGSDGCPETDVLVAARLRAGWDCVRVEPGPAGPRGIAWRCTL